MASENPKPAKFPWVPFVLSALLAYSAGLFLRLLELPLWNHPMFHVSGEPLMATHDAYAWMAGAKGTGRNFGRPMSEMLRLVHSFTGLPLGTINFWLPALMAPLVAVPLAWLCAWWKRPEAGLSAGIISAGALGFLFRTRLGYGDTDILTLFLPLVFGLLLILLLDFSVRNHATNSRYRPAYTFWLLSAGVGIIAWFYHWFYPNASIIVLLILLTGYGTALLLRTQSWNSLLGSFGIILGIWLGGMIGMMAAVLVLAGLRHRPEFTQKQWIGPALFALGVLSSLANGSLVPLVSGAAVKILKYAQLLTETEESLKLPIRLLSVREAQTVDWANLMARIGIHWSIFLIGITGFILLVRKHILALTFLPLLVLAVLSFKLGNRFTIYGSPVIGLGIGFLVSEILRRFTNRGWLVWLGQGAAGLLLFGIIFQTAVQLRPGPILPKVYAQTFLELQDKSPTDARLWQWWDYGYAAQYYAERRTIDDGGQQKGFYALALVHTTTSSRQAGQMIKFCTKTEKDQRMEMVQNGTEPKNPGAKILYYPTDPLLPLKEMENPKKAKGFVDSLALKDLSFPENLPAQYVVFSWENMNLAYWISYFGNWDLETGT
ncbi:MAG: STT3 domain-containing protein, partial [Desulfovibrionales bacterium]